MSMETRSSSALFKRAEQLKRWEESETNLEPTVPSGKSKKINFSAGCVFLAACAAGDREEVLRLIQKGADIDTANVDGLTALHQACIDDNLEMVEFLVEHGADVNRGDNEGWTPLHATASCGFISIAKYLIEKGGNVAAVNNDGELPLDIAESDEMEDMLQQNIDDQGIDCDVARNEEERMMLNDAREWLNGGPKQDKPHPKTGATALHVASAKGYIKVMDVLLQAGCDVNIQDFDGWTPLHAAAHWGQREACEILVEHFCDMDMKNYVGQTSFDVADSEMVRTLEELRKKQSTLQRDRDEINALVKMPPPTTIPVQPKRRSSVSRLSGAEKSSLINKDASAERQALGMETTPEVPQVQLQIQPREILVPPDDTRVEKKNRVNRDDPPRIPAVPEVNKAVPNNPTMPSLPPKQNNPDSNEESNMPSWRRPGSFRNSRGGEAPTKNLTLRIGDKEAGGKVTSPTGPPSAAAQEVVLRRTQSFEADEKFYRRYLELRAKINAGNSCPALPTRSASLKEKQFSRRGLREDGRVQSSVATATATVVPAPNSPQHNTSQVRSGVKGGSSSGDSTPTTPGGSKLSPGNIFKNFFKSFVPPVRDEESETQRKAHAKRVRETRRSTQGVTLEEIKSAEQLVKKKQQQQLHQATSQLNNNEQLSPEEVVVSARNAENLNSVGNDHVVTATITTGSGEECVGEEGLVRSNGERRPSWRLKVDNGSKFMLEDARGSGGVTETPLPRRTAVTTPVIDTGDTTITIPLRRANKLSDDKEHDKENDVRNAQATQAVIQRRRRPKRRSTGVVHVDMDEIDPDRHDSSGGGGDGDDHAASTNTESGSERSGRSSRLGSTSSLADDSRVAAPVTENGEVDYKKLYEDSRAENVRLKEILHKTEEDLHEAKSTADKSILAASKNTLSEMEKRERRAMERKLSEMEEELKQLQKLKAENERLRAENRALTRVVSKLTTSASIGK